MTASTPYALHQIAGTTVSRVPLRSDTIGSCTRFGAVGKEPPLNCGTLLKVLSHGQIDPGASTRHPGKFGSTHFATWYSDRKSTRLNSSHLGISYAVFC